MRNLKITYLLFACTLIFIAISTASAADVNVTDISESDKSNLKLSVNNFNNAELNVGAYDVAHTKVVEKIFNNNTFVSNYNNSASNYYGMSEELESIKSYEIYTIYQ